MASNLDELVHRAHAGDVEAQRELAIRFHNGDGVQRDEDLARTWLRFAADRGDAWSQTMYAAILRDTEEPDKEREAVHWLTLAAEQGYAEARYDLGIQQLHGVGTDVDVESAAVNIVMASLSGLEAARDLFPKMLPRLQMASWPSISARIKWSEVTFFMGKSADSVGPDGIVPFQTDEDWESADSAWLKDEEEVARGTFLSEPSLIAPAFNIKASVKKVHVGRATVEGEKLFATTISLEDIVQPDLAPVWWKPSMSTLTDIADTLALILGRRWIKATYMSY